MADDVQMPQAKILEIPEKEGFLPKLLINQINYYLQLNSIITS